jgi:hypothetical protein
MWAGGLTECQNGVDLIAGIYVLVVPDDGIEDPYFFVGPFATDMDACAWGEQQDDVHPTWFVLELEDPNAEPRILHPTIRPFASGRVEDIIAPAPDERSFYILCWTSNQYHLIGPFGDYDQCERFINHDTADDNFEGPYGNLRWCLLQFREPPSSPRLVPSAMPPLPLEEVQRRRLEETEDDAFFDSLLSRLGFTTSGALGTLVPFRKSNFPSDVHD